MKSRSPFLSKSPLLSKSPFKAIRGNRGSGLDANVDYNAKYGGGMGDALNQYRDLEMAQNREISGANEPGDYSQPEPVEQTLSERNYTSSNYSNQQQLAENQAALDAGGTRGQVGDRGFTGDTANDEVTMQQQGLGQAIAGSGSYSDNSLIADGSAIGEVTTTTSGERVAEVGPNTGYSGFVDDNGLAEMTTELADNPIGGADVAEYSGPVTPSNTDPDVPRYGQEPAPSQIDPASQPISTTNVENSAPPEQGANIPEAMGGDDMKAGCDCGDNYQGDGVLYNDM